MLLLRSLEMNGILTRPSQWSWSTWNVDCTCTGPRVYVFVWPCLLEKKFPWHTNSYINTEMFLFLSLYTSNRPLAQTMIEANHIYTLVNSASGTVLNIDGGMNLLVLSSFDLLTLPSPCRITRERQRLSRLAGFVLPG